MLLFLMSPIGRKVALVLALVLPLGVGYRVITNHAYEQGKASGAQAAWADAEKAHKADFEQAQATLKQQYNDLASQLASLKQERAAFDVKHTEAQTKRVQVEAVAEAQVEKAVEVEAASPVEADGLPPKQIIIDVAAAYKQAYEVSKHNEAGLQADYDESQKLSNKEIVARGIQIDTLTKDLEQTRSDRDFYKAELKGVTKRTHCRLKKIFTLGLGRCN